MSDEVTVVYGIDLSEFDKTVNLKIDESAKKYLCSRLLSYDDVYVPKDSGMLAASGRVVDGGNAIEYDTPYARYQWYGKLMVDPITVFNEDYGFWSRPNTPKVLTDRDLNYQGAPLRGSRWTERAFTANREQLEQELLNYITRKEK